MSIENCSDSPDALLSLIESVKVWVIIYLTHLI